jgi:bacterioferritin-associated ferredoxin
MYICLCHGVTDSAIREAVDIGAHTFKRLSLATGCGTQCGSCAPQAKKLLSETLKAQKQKEYQTPLQIVSVA